MTHAWKEGIAPRLLVTEAEIHAARDAGELDEFPGTPDSNGETFLVTGGMTGRLWPAERRLRRAGSRWG